MMTSRSPQWDMSCLQYMFRQHLHIIATLIRLLLGKFKSDCLCHHTLTRSACYDRTRLIQFCIASEGMEESTACERTAFWHSHVASDLCGTRVNDPAAVKHNSTSVLLLSCRFRSRCFVWICYCQSSILVERRNFCSSDNYFPHSHDIRAWYRVTT